MIQPAQVEVTLFNTKEEAEAAIQAEYKKIKSLQGEKQNKINAKYDAEYVDAVKKGEMTKEQWGRSDQRACSCQWLGR